VRGRHCFFVSASDTADLAAVLAAECAHKCLLFYYAVQVVVIDEIGTEAECAAARTIAQRGVQLVATAHGNELQNLVKNPALSDLIGGIQSVTLGMLHSAVYGGGVGCHIMLRAAGHNSTAARQRVAEPGQKPCTVRPHRRHPECHARCGSALFSLLMARDGGKVICCCERSSTQVGMQAGTPDICMQRFRNS
jgi:hypothetical protein